MHAKQAPQRRAPQDRRANFRLPLSDHFLRLLHSVRSACQVHSSWLPAITIIPNWLPARCRHPLTGYLLALCIDVVTASLTLLLVTPVLAFALPGALLLVGIMLVALTCGVGPGVLATGVSLLLLEGAILPASHTFGQHPASWVDVVVLLMSGIGLSLLAGQNGWGRRQAEVLADSLRTAKASSDLERQRLRALLEVLPVPIAMVDREGRFLEHTPATQTLWGDPASWPRELAEVPAYPAWRPDTGQPVSRDELPLVRALTRGESILNEELELETVAGQRHILLNSATPIRDGTGAIRGAASLLQDITERKRLEAALRQAEREAAARARELEAIFEALTDGLLVYDAEGHPVLPEYLALSRLLRGEVLTGSQAAEDCLHTPDGREVIFSMTGRPLRDAKGTIIGAVGISRDETERRRLEREVAEHASQLEAIFESIADGIIVTDRQGRILHMNQAYRTLLGLEQDPTGWTLPELEELAGFAGYSAMGQRVIAGEDTIARVLRGEVLTNEQSVDTILRTRAERETLLNLTGAPIRDATGQVVGGVFVSRDVTEQRHLEQQTREALEALLAMSEALVQVLGATSAAPSAGAPRASSETDPVLPVVAHRLAELTCRVLGCQYVSMVAVDPTTERLTPITVVGLSLGLEQQWWASWDRPFRLDECLPPSLAARLRAGEPGLIESAEQSHRWHPLFAEMTLLLVPMQIGDTLLGVLWLEEQRLHLAEARPQETAVTQAVARLGALVLERERLLRDRTEARANELALRETQAQMETFLGMAGHELKNPLTSLKLTLQLVERRLRRSTRQEPDAAHALTPLLDQVARARHQTNRLERLVNDLLDASRVRAGKLELHPELADLVVTVRETVDEQREIHPERTLTFQLPPERTATVLADADRIGQVVTNYLTNALKYSPADRPVKVGLDLDEGQARVWVHDEGPGIPPEEQAHIWDRFHRVSGIQVQSGTGMGLGLGLHICRTIVERHQGQVGVESVPGQGSTFWFILPIRRQEEALVIDQAETGEPTEKEEKAHGNPTSSQGPRRG